jgi:hypothetical protein
MKDLEYAVREFRARLIDETPLTLPFGAGNECVLRSTPENRRR